MKNSHLLKVQPDRDSLAENLALTLALPIGLIAAVSWFVLFYSFCLVSAFVTANKNHFIFLPCVSAYYC